MSDMHEATKITDVELALESFNPLSHKLKPLKNIEFYIGQAVGSQLKFPNSQ